MKRKGLLLDRDGVINEDHGFVSSVDQFDFVDGLFPFLHHMQNRGFRIAVVTNQSGVARSYYKVEDFENLTNHMVEAFNHEGIEIDLTLACYTHPQGDVAKLARESYWRKPKPGMIFEAAQRLNLDLARSIMIGDKETDMMAAMAAGVGQAFWLNGGAVQWPNVHSVKDYIEITSLLSS